MRKIEYIFIDSDCQDDNNKSCQRTVPNLGYHYVVNSEGLVTNPTDISLTANIIIGPIYNPDKYNRRSIFVRYCGALPPEDWILESETSSSAIIMAQRTSLLRLLICLRKRFPEAKILGVSEIDSRELYCKNIIVSKAMNQLRRELSDLP